MDRSTRYPKEVRERAVRFVFEHEREYPSQWAAITPIATKLGMTAETLRKWVRASETDQSLRLLSEVRELSSQAHVRTSAANGRLRPLAYVLQSVQQRPQFVAKVRELSTEVHQTQAL
jgi:transposase